MLIPARQIPTQEIVLPLLQEKRVRLFVRREDMIHAKVSGNKFRKLQYNLVAAQEQGHDSLLTFGGAFSNHIAATAAAAKLVGMNSIGVIRGEELGKSASLNATLNYAKAAGMQLKFMSRADYRVKDSSSIREQLIDEFGSFYWIPEGGTNALAVKGCEEILSEADSTYTHICCAVGTGGTLAGIVNSAAAEQQILGFPALKGDFLRDEIDKFAVKKTYRLITDYHFGGYAKVNSALIHFINEFRAKTTILLDPVYTGKMLFGVLDMAAKGHFEPGSSILAIHTGGLQGIEGMNHKLKNKDLPTILL